MCIFIPKRTSGNPSFCSSIDLKTLSAPGRLPVPMSLPHCLGIFNNSIPILQCQILSVFLACHDKIPQTTWLSHQKFIFSQFWRMKSPKSSLHQVLALGKGSSWLEDGCLGEKSLPPPLFLRQPVLSDQGPTFMASFNLHYLLKGLSSHIVTLRVRSEAGKYFRNTVQSTATSCSISLK